MKSQQTSFEKLQNSVASDWSRKQLELSPGDAVSTHRQVCEFLKSCQFRPPTTVRPAIIGTLQPKRVLRSAIIREIVAREMLGRLTADFFELTPKIRERRLNELSEHVKEFPQLTWRLQILRSGVSIEDAVPRGDDTASQLASAAADVFVMSPEAAARAGREESIDKSAARKKKAAVSVAARSFSQWLKLQPPGSLTVGQRLDRATARPKHLRPTGDYSKIGFLVLVILAALTRIASLPRPAGVSGSSRPSYVYTSPPVMPAAHEQMQTPVNPPSPETMAMLLGKDKFEAYQNARQRLDDAKKRMEEIRQRSKQQRMVPNGAARAFADKLQETYDKLQSQDGDLQEYWEQQKSRTDRVLNGNPFRSSREVPREPVDADTPVPGFILPGAKDPAKEVDDFLDQLNNPQTEGARP